MLKHCISNKVKKILKIDPLKNLTIYLTAKNAFFARFHPLSSPFRS